MPLPEPEKWYSTDITNGKGFDEQNHEQFTAYFRVLPKEQLLNGKRRERQVQLEKLAARLTTAMRDLGYIIAESRALEKYQFAHFPAQVTVHGFVVSEESSSSSYRQNQHPVTERTVDSNGGIRTGMGGNLQHGQNLTPEFRAAVAEFKADVDAMLASDFIAEGFNVSLIKLDYMGVTFGAKGVMFPRQ